MRIVRLIALFFPIAVFSSAALAATITPKEGQVLVNEGKGYQQLTSSLEVKPGTTVVANPGGSAQVLYPDGCSVVVKPGSVYTVTHKSPCVGQAGEPARGVDGTTVAIGAAVVGGGVAGLVLLNKDKSSSP
jgi:hypothetical protein